MIEKFCPSKIIWWCVNHLMTWEICSHSCVMADRTSMPIQLRWLGTGSYSVVHRQSLTLYFSIKYSKEGKRWQGLYWHLTSSLLSLVFLGFLFFAKFEIFGCHNLSWGNICSKLTWLTHFFNNTPSLSVWKNYNECVSKTAFCFFCSKELHRII